jgi:hypothetical protein
MNFKKLASLFVLTLAATPALFASYSINRTDGGNNQLLVRGRAYVFQIQNTDIPRDLHDVQVQFNPPSPAPRISVGSGVQTGPDTYALDQNGVLLMTITLDLHVMKIARDIRILNLKYVRATSNEKLIVSSIGTVDRVARKESGCRGECQYE